MEDMFQEKTLPCRHSRKRLQSHSFTPKHFFEVSHFREKYMLTRYDLSATAQFLAYDSSLSKCSEQKQSPPETLYTLAKIVLRPRKQHKVLID